MPVSVRLDFAPPPQDDVVALHVYEGATVDGVYSQIERTMAVGVYPTYISHYTTDLANSVTDYFSIAWELGSGVLTPRSRGVKGGGDTSVVAKVVERVMQRDRTLDEAVVAQEAEAAVYSFFGTDPYDATLVPTYKELNGLVLLVLARSLIVRMIQTTASGSADSFTLGLVSAKADTSSSSQVNSDNAIKKLLDLAMSELGVPSSVILELAEPKYASGLTSYDHSRLIGWIGLE